MATYTIQENPDNSNHVEVIFDSGQKDNYPKDQFTVRLGAGGEYVAIIHTATRAEANKFTYSEVTTPAHVSNEALYDALEALFFLSSGPSVGSFMVLIGGIDASTNPNYPAADEIGWAWRITAPGRIGGALGAQVEAGDLVEAHTVSAGGTQAAVGANYFILQTNTRAATQSEVNTANGTATYVSPSTLLAGQINKSIVKNVVVEIEGDGATTTFTVPHGLNTRDIDPTVIESAAPYSKVDVTVNMTTTSAVDIVFAVAPAAGVFFRVIMIGKVV